MAFNQGLRVEQTSKKAVPEFENPLHRTSSILSDSQSLWVLFSPSLSGDADESDILSLSNDDRDSKVSSHFSKESDVSQSEGADSLIDTFGDIAGNNSMVRSDEYPDGTSYLTATSEVGHLMLDALRSSRLRDRIQRWGDSMQEDTIDDNVASWDLDENLSLYNSGSSSKSRPFYGDDLLEGMSRQERSRVRKITKKLKHSLHLKNQYEGLLVRLILYNISQLSGPRQHQIPLHLGVSSRTSTYSRMLAESNTRPFLDSYLRNNLNCSRIAIPKDRPFSETTSNSSAILCGGSWDEI